MKVESFELLKTILTTMIYSFLKLLLQTFRLLLINISDIIYAEA